MIIKKRSVLFPDWIDLDEINEASELIKNAPKGDVIVMNSPGGQVSNIDYEDFINSLLDNVSDSLGLPKEILLQPIPINPRNILNRLNVYWANYNTKYDRLPHSYYLYLQENKL